MLIRLLLVLAAQVLAGAFALARADGLAPYGSGALDTCYEAGAGSALVPCFRRGRTWTRLLRPTDDGSAITARAIGAPVARSLASRLGDEINVLDYGAKGDCLNDDSKAINDAWKIGQALYFPLPPGGCYLILSPLTPPLVTPFSLHGLGQGVSVIKAGAAMSAMLAKGPGYMFGARISGLTFNGNAQADYILDIAQMAGAAISGNDIMNARVANLRLGDGVNAVQNSFWSHNNFMNHESLYGGDKKPPRPDYNVLILPGATDNQFTDNIVANARIANIKDGSQYGQNFFLQNHAYGYPYPDNYAQYCFWALGGSQFIGNEVDGCSVAGYRLDGDNTLVTGSHAQWPGGTAGSAVFAQIASGARYNVVSGNKVMPGHLDPSRVVVQLGTPGVGNIIAPNAGASETANQSQGHSASSPLTNAFVRSNGQTYAAGDRQEVTQILFSQTTDATPKRLTADGSAAGAANTFNIPQFNAWAFSIRATCRSATTGDTAMWYLDSEQLTRAAAASSAALTGSPTAWTKTRSTSGATSWGMTYGADTTNSGLALTFTGAAGNRIACHALVLGMSGT